MTVANFSISEEKVKLKYQERYTSEGTNEKATAIPRGCYRGFLPRKFLVADASIWLAVDPLGYGLDEDSFAVYAEYNSGASNYDGWSVSIREIEDIELDLSASALIPIPGGVTYLYVYIEATYEVASPTTATYGVSDEDPSQVASSNYNPDAILVGRIPVTPAASTIDFDITTPSVYTDVTTARKWPIPTATDDWTTLGAGDDRWGLVDAVKYWSIPTTDQKDAMDNAASPDASNPFATEGESSDLKLTEPAAIDETGHIALTKIQLSGETLYVGKGGVGTANVYFSLRKYQDIEEPLQSATNDLYFVSAIYDSTDDHELNPGTEADADGFYADPWVYITPAFSGNFTVLCSRESLFKNLDPGVLALAMAFIRSNALDVFAKAVSGSPESLTEGSVESQLGELLSDVNDLNADVDDRVEIINPNANPTDPVLVWRSHNIASDAAVTGDTVSLYVSNQGFFICRGMYLADATDAYRAPVSPETKCFMLSVDENRVGLLYKDVTTDTTWEWWNPALWDSYTAMSSTGLNIFGSASHPNMTQLDDWQYFQKSAPTTITNANYHQRFSDGSDNWICEVVKESTLHRIANAELDTPGSGDTVKPISLTVPMTSIQHDGNSGMVRVLCTTQNKSGYSSGHALDSTSWSARMNIGVQAADKGALDDYIYNCFNSSFNVYEEVWFDLNVYFQQVDPSSTVTSTVIRSVQGCNFRNRWNTKPSTIDISTDRTKSPTATMTVEESDKWGFRVMAFDSSVNQSLSFDCYGKALCYT